MIYIYIYFLVSQDLMILIILLLLDICIHQSASNSARPRGPRLRLCPGGLMHLCHFVTVHHRMMSFRLFLSEAWRTN